MDYLRRKYAVLILKKVLTGDPLILPDFMLIIPRTFDMKTECSGMKEEEDTEGNIQ